MNSNRLNADIEEFDTPDLEELLSSLSKKERETPVTIEILIRILVSLSDTIKESYENMVKDYCDVNSTVLIRNFIYEENRAVRFFVQAIAELHGLDYDRLLQRYLDYCKDYDKINGHLRREGKDGLRQTD